MSLQQKEQRQNFKGGEKLKEEKLEQLRKVFKRMIKNFLNSPDDKDSFNTEDDDIKILANNLVLEVKIRINNK